MKKQNFAFIGKAIKFLLFFLLIDFFLGALAEYLFLKQSSGKYARITYALKKSNADILIFGSSHANRHYVPTVIESKLHFSCYNSGVQGQGILFHSVVEDIIVKRTKPKIIILNIDENCLFESQKSYERLADLHPYYLDYSNSIRPILKLKSKMDYLKLYLKSYSFNSTIVHIVRYILSPQLDQSGYVPLYGKMTPPINKPQTSIKQNRETIKNLIDVNLVNALHSFIQTARINNINLFFVASPKIDGIPFNSDSNDLIREIAKNENIPFIDFNSDKNFIGAYELFNDGNHLNNVGAILFSELLSDSICHRINADKLRYKNCLDGKYFKGISLR